MPYITSVERIGLERGLERGREEGREEGREQGHDEGMREALRRVVEARFGAAPQALEQRIATADRATLDQLLDRSIKARSIDDLR